MYLHKLYKQVIYSIKKYVRFDFTVQQLLFAPAPYHPSTASAFHGTFPSTHLAH